MKPRGLFITVEGVEGVGKSTNITFLQQLLEGNGIDLVVTREPGGSQLGEDIRQLLLCERTSAVDPVAELLLIFAARAQHLRELIEPALAAGSWVLCDRFTDASYAYQGGGRGLDKDLIGQLETLVQGSLRPDRTFLLDAPVSIGIARARGRGELDRFEREEIDFFERVRATYLELAALDQERYRLVDACAGLAEVQAQLRTLCADLLARCEHGQAAP